MKITYVIPEDLDLQHNVEWRCKIPTRAINRTGRHSASLLANACFCSNSTEARQICQQTDIIVVHHHLWGKTLSVIQHWRARDKIVIADFDEAYHLLDKEDPRYAFWMDGKDPPGSILAGIIEPPPIVQFKWALQNVEAATLPSKRLADDWQAFTHIELVPNYIDMLDYGKFTPQEHPGFILGWSGRSSRLASFRRSGALEAVLSVLRERPNVQVMFCCDDPAQVNSLGLPESRVIIHNRQSGSPWPQPLAMFDAALVPLQGDFDHRSSVSEILEYMVTRIPWAASQGPAVHDFRSYGWLVENSPGAWEKILFDMIDHQADYRFEASQTPYIFGISQSIDENVHRLIDVYARVSNRQQQTGQSIPGQVERN